jgi:hypothetical protein
VPTPARQEPRSVLRYTPQVFGHPTDDRRRLIPVAYRAPLPIPDPFPNSSRYTPQVHRVHSRMSPLRHYPPPYHIASTAPGGFRQSPHSSSFPTLQRIPPPSKSDDGSWSSSQGPKSNVGSDPGTITPRATFQAEDTHGPVGKNAGTLPLPSIATGSDSGYSSFVEQTPFPRATPPAAPYAGWHPGSTKDETLVEHGRHVERMGGRDTPVPSNIARHTPPFQPSGLHQPEPQHPIEGSRFMRTMNMNAPPEGADWTFYKAHDPPDLDIPYPDLEPPGNTNSTGRAPTDRVDVFDFQQPDSGSETAISPHQNPHRQHQTQRPGQLAEFPYLAPTPPPQDLPYPDYIKETHMQAGQGYRHTPPKQHFHHTALTATHQQTMDPAAVQGYPPAVMQELHPLRQHGHYKGEEAMYPAPYPHSRNTVRRQSRGYYPPHSDIDEESDTSTAQSTAPYVILSLKLYVPSAEPARRIQVALPRGQPYPPSRGPELMTPVREGSRHIRTGH